MKKLLLVLFCLSGISTFSQVRLVKDLVTGSLDSSPFGMFVYNNKMFFSASAGFGSYKYIWSSDGTNTGTQTINSGGSPIKHDGSHTFYHTELNGEIYVTAQQGGQFQDAVYKFLPSSNSASFVFSLFSLNNDASSLFGMPKVINNKIVFSPMQSFSQLTTIGVEPAYYNGSPAFLANISNNYRNSFPVFWSTLNGFLYFTADSYGTTGRELYKTDGTPGGTSLYLDVNIGGASSSPSDVNVLGTQLTFVGTHGTYGRELFKTNGLGNLVLIKDIKTKGDGNSNPTNVTVLNNKLYFSADNGSNGQELWISTGDFAGTNLIKDINPTGSSNPSRFTALGSTIFFVADDGMNGSELWKTDGTAAGTVLVKNINLTGDSNPSYLTEYNGKIYFAANDGVNGIQLWVTDGSQTATSMIVVNPNGSSDLSNLIAFNGELFFSANAGIGIGKELYAYLGPSIDTSKSMITDEFVLYSNAIALFPNPSKNYFELSGDVSIEKVEVYSLQGQLVKSFKNESQYVVSDLAKGMYVVKINATEGILNKTLIVE